MGVMRYFLLSLMTAILLVSSVASACRPTSGIMLGVTETESAAADIADEYTETIGDSKACQGAEPVLLHHVVPEVQDVWIVSLKVDAEAQKSCCAALADAGWDGMCAPSPSH